MVKKSYLIWVVIIIVMVILAIYFYEDQEKFSPSDVGLDEAYSCHQECDWKLPGKLKQCQLDGSYTPAADSKEGRKIEKGKAPPPPIPPACQEYNSCLRECHNNQAQSIRSAGSNYHGDHQLL